MNTGLPETVKVGPYRYVVEIAQEPFLDDRKEMVLCGEHRPNEGVIRVIQGSPDRMFVTFWHEVLHAVDDVAGTNLNEEAVERLSVILAMVLIDNGYVVLETE